MTMMEVQDARDHSTRVYVQLVPYRFPMNSVQTVSKFILMIASSDESFPRLRFGSAPKGLGVAGDSLRSRRLPRHTSGGNAKGESVLATAGDDENEHPDCRRSSAEAMPLAFVFDCL